MAHVRESGRLVTQPSRVPTRKVGAGALAGAITTVAVSVAEFYGLDVPPELAASVTVLLTFVASYFVREYDSPLKAGT